MKRYTTPIIEFAVDAAKLAGALCLVILLLSFTVIVSLFMLGSICIAMVMLSKIIAANVFVSDITTTTMIIRLILLLFVWSLLGLVTSILTLELKIFYVALASKDFERKNEDGYIEKTISTCTETG